MILIDIRNRFGNMTHKDASNSVPKVIPLSLICDKDDLLEAPASCSGPFHVFAIIRSSEDGSSNTATVLRNINGKNKWMQFQKDKMSEVQEEQAIAGNGNDKYPVLICYR